MTECTLCGAPYLGSSPYCSDACEVADNPDDDWDEGDGRLWDEPEDLQPR